MKAGPLSKRKLRTSLLCVAWLIQACGGGSDSESTALSPLQSLTGSIKSITGSQSEMNQWVLALVQRDTGIAHVGVVNAVGNYAIPGVELSLAHTFVLLDPQFKLAAVLSSAGADSNKVRQYFRAGQALLPSLVHNGPIITYTDQSGLSWESQQANDTDADLIPDGMDLASLRLLDKGSDALALAAADSDGDGIDNSTDSDIDGDGIANWFDGDDDGDGTVDAFDADTNGDTEADLSQAIGDLYFKEFVQYMAVQVSQDVQEDQSLATSLTVTAKLHEAGDPSAMKVRVPKVLSEGAKAIVFSQERGEAIESAWDLSLADDGLNEDGAAQDRTYARRIKLATGIVPKAKQVIFIQYQTGSDDSLRTREFAYTFPDLVTGVIKGNYDTATKTVSLEGTPFATVTDYRWSVHIYDASSYKIFSSAPIPGTTATYVIPNGILEAGQSYTARIVATAFERIPSFPSWVVRSASFTL